MRTRLRLLLAALALAFGIVVAPAGPAHAVLSNCPSTVVFTTRDGVTYPFAAYAFCYDGTGQMRIRIKCWIRGTVNTWYTRSGPWVGKMGQSTQSCYSGDVLIDHWLQFG